MNAFERLGYDVDTLLASAGLRDTDLNDPDARIPCEAYGALVSRAQQERFTPNLALELARLTPMGAYPLLDYLVLTSDTVGAGVRQLARYFRLDRQPGRHHRARGRRPDSRRDRPRRRRSASNTSPR